MPYIKCWGGKHNKPSQPTTTRETQFILVFDKWLKIEEKTLHVKYTVAYNRLFSSQVMVRRDEALVKADFRAAWGRILLWR